MASRPHHARHYDRRLGPPLADLTSIGLDPLHRFATIGRSTPPFRNVKPPKGVVFCSSHMRTVELGAAVLAALIGLVGLCLVALPGLAAGELGPFGLVW